MLGLGCVKTLGGKSDVWNNDVMTSLQGLEGLNIIAGSAISNGSDVLASLQDLDSLKTAGDDVDLWETLC